MARGEGVLVSSAVPVATAEPVLASSVPARIRLRRRTGLAGRVTFIAFVLLVLYGPLILLAVFSFNNSVIISLPWSGFTLKWYPLAWDNPILRGALYNSIIVACVVAPSCIVIGTLMAFGLTRFRFRVRGMIGGLVGAPLILPWLVIGIAALLFFVQLQKVFPFFHLSLRTVVATQVVCTFPLVTAIVSAQLLRFERAQEEAAIDLGASRLQVLRYVILPHITAGPRRRGDLCVHVVVQQLRDQLLHDRLPADLPGMGLRDPADRREPADHQRDLDAHLGRAGRDDRDRVADPAKQGRRRRGDTRRSGGGGRGTQNAGRGCLMATPAVAVEAGVRSPRRRRRFTHWPFTALPTALLLVFFVAPMLLMIQMSLLKFPPNTSSGYTLSHYAAVFGDPLYRRIAVNTFVIATLAQLVMLGLGIPLAYLMAFRAGRWELLLLLLLVLADELNPIVKIYAWRMLLGREGLINSFLLGIHAIHQPITWLLFNRFAVVVTLAASWITYTTIPIYAGYEGDPARRCSRPRSTWARVVDPNEADPDPARGARHLHRDDPGVHPDVYRLRDAEPGRWHELVHAGQRGQRPDPHDEQLG